MIDINIAKNLAALFHANQKYGEQSYMTHLNHVVAVLRELYDGDLDENHELFHLAFLHDSIEDCKEHKVYDIILSIYGDDFAKKVFAISRGEGESRVDYYKRMAAFGDASVLTIKCCDRYANCTYGVETAQQKKYLAEYPQFRASMRSPIGKVSADEAIIIMLDDWYFQNIIKLNVNS